MFAFLNVITEANKWSWCWWWSW